MLLRKSFKILGIFWLILFAFKANATNYYLSNSGNDANSGTDPSAPWQTLSKLNSFKNLKPGDNVLFKRGDTFYGSITVSNSGTAGNPITYGAYDAGEKPVISGFTTVSKWTNLGGNIWESTNTVSALSTCNMVVVNGVNTPMGRYPNSGYLTFQSHNGNTSITSSSLTGTPDWTGAEVVIRSSQWTLERKLITSQSSGTLSYSASILIPTNGFGLFIQNDVRTLDTENELYYDPSTKKLRIYSSFAPSNVMVTTVNTVTSIHGSYVNIENLTIEGANNYCFYNDWAISNVSIQHCNISYSGIDGISMAGCHYLTVNSSTISNINDKAINLFYDDLNSTISNNIISNTGLIPGMGAGGQVDYIAIFSDGNNGLTATSNIITNTGYIGIYFTGNYCLVQNNFVDSFCTVIQDGGGIYTSDNSYLQRSIDGNIILNGIGNAEGTNNPSRLLAHGIYLDDNSANVQVSNNTISKNALYGIFLHNAHNLNIYGNTVYDNGSQLGTQHDAGQNSITDVNLKHNLFIAKTPSQYAAEFINYENNTMPTGTLDSNYYARPIDDSLTINIITSSSNTPITLAKWTSMHSVDVHSLKSPKVITDTSDLRFEYNRNSISHTASLPDYYMDITGVVLKTFKKN
jgi:parallel beta-helix repeat protein